MIRYGLLGPLEVRRDGAPVDIGGGQQRALLALLLLDAGRVVSVERIVDALWPDDPPVSAMSSIQALISRLRAALREGDDRELPIRRRPPGYVLEVERDASDLDRFIAGCDDVRRLVAEGRWAEAAARAAETDALLRGPLVVEYADAAWVRPTAAVVDGRRLALLEDEATALLGVGRDDEALLAASRARELGPLDERACRLAVLALHRTGRTAEALAEWRAFADTLDEELGLEPGPELRALQSAILRQDPALASWPAEPGRDPSPSSLPAVDPASALVGRDRETAAVAAATARTRAGGSTWIVVSGRAGIGKTAIADDSLARWLGSGGAGARIGCPDDPALPAFWPVRRLLEAIGADPDVVLEPPSRDDPVVARFAVAAQVAAALRAAAAANPLLVVVDDVQWADDATAALLAQLAETERIPRLAVLLTCRDEPAVEGVQRLLNAAARRPDHLPLAPAPLTDGQIAELVTRISSRAPGPDELAELVRRTEGSPFFVTEYARLPESARDTLPPGVRTVLERRLAAVRPEVRDVLQVAAVLGDPVDARLVGAVMELPRPELADRLDAAATERLVAVDPDTGGYAFAHALMRDRLLLSLSPLRQQDLHLRAADALVGRGGTDAVTRRARHLVAAGDAADVGEVVAACVAAARDAERRWSGDEAVRWWERALAAADGEVDGARHDEVVVGLASALVRNGQGQRMLDLVDGSMLEAWRSGRLESVGTVASLLLRLTGCWPWPAYGADPGALMARLAGLEPKLADAPRAQARVLAALAIGSCYDLDPFVPDALSARAIAVAESTGDEDALADALLGRAMTFSGVAIRSDEVLALLDRLARTPHSLERFDAVVADGIASMSALALGDVARASALVERGSENSAALHLPVSAAQFRWAALTIDQWRTDDVNAIEASFDEAWEQHTRTELTQSVTFILARLALRWEQGRLAEGLELTDRNPFLSPWIDAIVDAERAAPGAAEALVREAHRPEPTSWTAHARATLLAHAAADLGVPDAAPPLRAVLEPVEGCLANFGQSSMVGPVALALARLDLLTRDPESASRRVDLATELAQRTGGGNALVRCRLERQRIALASGFPADPVELAAIRDEAERRGLGGVASAADALLSEPVRA